MLFEKEIKEHVKKIIFSYRNYLKDKIVLDIPAGEGYSYRVLKEIGARVEAYDVFTDKFDVDGFKCREADLNKHLPIKDNYADFILCQEGIEHIAGQDNLFGEFYRILKTGGRLIITTPNYSNLKSKVSHLLTESEKFYHIMPLNELDSIWRTGCGCLYYGHVFTAGIFKLRLLSKLAGLEIVKIHNSGINISSLFLLLLLYPLILSLNFAAYLKALCRSKNRDVYSVLLRYSVNPRILINNHLIVEFEKNERFIPKS